MIALIAARSKNNVIGKGGRIPWRIRGEQRQFRELTTGHCVVMGRRSYEEIGHPLPNRLNIVVSRTGDFTGESLMTVPSLAAALEAAKDQDVYISGGYGLFAEAIPLADVIYLTEVDTVVEDGDTFFPDFPEEEFRKTVGERVEGEIPYTRIIYTRIGKEKLHQ